MLFGTTLAETFNLPLLIVPFTMSVDCVAALNSNAYTFCEKREKSFLINVLRFNPISNAEKCPKVGESISPAIPAPLIVSDIY